MSSWVSLFSSRGLRQGEATLSDLASHLAQRRSHGVSGGIRVKMRFLILLYPSD